MKHTKTDSSSRKRHISLQLRLWMLTACAIGAMLVLSFVAWRLARATETFTLRQAEWSLHNAVAEIANRAPRNPLEGSAPATPRSSPFAQPFAPKMLPHEREIFAAYSDSLARLTALALHRYEDTAGGFVRRDGQLAGIAPSRVNDRESLPNAEDVETIASLSREAQTKNESVERTIKTDDALTMIEVYPFEADGINAMNLTETANDNPIIAAWAQRRLSNIAGVGDTTNIIALVLLVATGFIVLALAFSSVRLMSRDVANIEQGLNDLTKDLNVVMPQARTPELDRIRLSINNLAAALRRNIERRQTLESEVRRAERLAALGRVVAGVAHEIRNPLAAMRLKMQTTMRANYPPDKLPRTFQVVTEEIDRLDRLVHRLLELGRPPVLALTNIDVCELARRRLAMFAEIAARQNVRLEFTDDDEAAHSVDIEGDSARLTQVFDNLIQNALEAMPGGGTLIITCKLIDAGDAPLHARLKIKDDGSGIAPQMRENLFEPFQTGRAEGTGLGLAITREIVEAHGGTITFESRIAGEAENDATQQGSGTTFTIDLPRKFAASN